MTEENEIDIEELETILDIHDNPELKSFLSSSNPNSFLKAVSLIVNSNQFDSIDTDSSSAPPSDLEIQDLILNATNFFSFENADKFKIDFDEKSPTEEVEIIFENSKETNQEQNSQTTNKNNNKKKQKIKRRKRKMIRKMK